MRSLHRAILLQLLVTLAIGFVLTPFFLRPGSREPAGQIVALWLGLMIASAIFGIAWFRIASDAVDRMSDATRRLRLADPRETDPLTSNDQWELAHLARAAASIAQSVETERLQTGEERLAIRQILDAVGEGLIAVNRSKRIVLANSRVGELFGAIGPIVGRSYVEVVRQSALLAALDGAFEGRDAMERTTIPHGDGERTIEMRVFPLRADSQIAAVAIFIDVSRIARLERVRRDFIADFSHEARTPITGLRSALETLESPRLSGAEEEQLRRIVMRQLSRLERLVGDLSELNRIESGELVLQKETVDLRRLLQTLTDDLTEHVHARGMSITLRGEGSMVSADPMRLEQIFTNLIDNAVKHAGTSKEIVVEIEDAEDRSIVRVTDFGDGIAPEEQRRIFNRFYRVDRSRSQDVQGMGLGLAITKHLVLLHGGSVQVRSEIGTGSTFTVTLPKSGGEAAEGKNIRVVV